MDRCSPSPLINISSLVCFVFFYYYFLCILISPLSLASCSLLWIKMILKSKVRRQLDSWLCTNRIICVLPGVSIVMIKYREQKAGWSGKGLCGLHFLIVALQPRVRRETSTGQEPGGRRDHGVVLLMGFLSMSCPARLCIKPRASWPGMTPYTIDWSLPHQSLIKKTPYRFACSLFSWRHFPNWGSILSNDFSLCNLT